MFRAKPEGVFAFFLTVARFSSVRLSRRQQTQE